MGGEITDCVTAGYIILFPLSFTYLCLQFQSFSSHLIDIITLLGEFGDLTIWGEGVEPKNGAGSSAMNQQIAHLLFGLFREEVG